MTYIDDLMNELCPDGVEWKELGEVLDYDQPTKYIVKSKEYREEYRTPVLTPGQTFILGYTNETDGIYRASKVSPVIIFDDFTTASKWVDFDFKVKSSAMKILFVHKEHVDNIVMRYIWHYLGTITYSPEEHGRQWISKYSKLKIPVPPLQVQEEIVKILDNFTNYLTELTAELTKRMKQYSFYRDRLLSFEDEVYEVEWKTIGDISKRVISGGTPKKGVFAYYDGDIPWLRTQEVDFKEIYSTELTITEEGLASSSAKWVNKNAIIVAMYGATAGKVGIAKIPLTTNQACCNIEVDEGIALYRFVYHWLSYNYQVLKGMGQGSQSNINAKMIREFKIPVPPLQVQSRIIQVLDQFDTVCNDLNIGLPKEIELRQKQYEYFRDELLTFAARGIYTSVSQGLIKVLTWVFGPIRVSLGSVAKYRTEKISTDDLTLQNYIGVDNLLQNRKGKVDASILPTSQNVNIYLKNDILIGNIRPYLRKMWFATNNGGASPDVLVIQNKVNKALQSRFLYHVLASDSFFEYSVQYSKGSKMPRGDKKANLEYTFILPPLDEQNRIVSILDKFDTLTSDLTQGLPKEIAQRQAQYEYYRDKLLSFKRKA